ncbi:DMT family transporter [Chthonobacter albigriseus]|uniref:DMT family transporter n=1 Tax=Chthonobacter albigriseus TaxID=1683161 RepID=UPI0015EF6EF9|nr:DMT family transporter [Chthonobacter albigriseus]
MSSSSKAAVAQPAPRDLLGFLLGLIGVTIFGGTLPMTRIAVATFDPWFVTMGRAGLAAILAGALLLVMRRPFPPPQARRSLWIAAVTTVVGFPIFSAIALLTVPASHGAVVLGLLPLGTSIAAVVVNGERPSPRFWAWSLAGAALVLAFTLRTADASIGWGDVLMVIAGASASTGYAHYARISRWTPGWEGISWALVIMAPLTIPATLFLFEPAYWNAPREAVLSLLYVSVLSVFIGFFFWNAGLAIGGVAKVGQVQLLQAFISLAIAATLLGERVDATMIGFALAVMGVVIMARRSSVQHRR